MPVGHARGVSSLLAHAGDTPLLLAHATGAQPPVAQARGAPSPIVCARGALMPSPVPEAPHLLKVCVCTKIFLWFYALILPSLRMVPFFSCRPSPPLGSLSCDNLLTSLWYTVPLLPSPLGCLHTTNATPLPGTDLQSLSLSVQSFAQASQGVVSGVVVLMVFVALSLCLPQSSCWAFL